MIEEGIKGEAKVSVGEDNTAQAMCSGGLPVFATPAMSALMEKACFDSVEPLMENGKSTVGTYIEVHHVSATPKGKEVTAESILTAVDGRRLKFTVKAYDDGGIIGDAVHERVIIDVEKFLTKAQSKRT